MSDILDLSDSERNKLEDEAIKRAKKSPASRIDQLQQKLYSPNTQFQIRKRKPLREKMHQIDNDWEKDQGESFIKSMEKPSRFSIFAKIAIIAFIFFLGSVGYAFYVFYGGQQTISGNDVEVTVIGPVSVGGGEELSLDIIVENRNDIPIYTVDLVIEYPDGTKLASDLKTDLPRVREGLGDIAPNTVVKKSYKAALFGQEGDRKNIDVRVEYRLPGSTSIFEKGKTFELALQSSPVRLTVNTVKEITANQELIFDVTLASNSNKTLKDVFLNVVYPFGFTYSSADIRPNVDDNGWYFDELEPNEEKKFKLRGVLEGQNTEERVFKWGAGIADESDKNKLGVVFVSLPKSVTIIEPFLAMSLAIDGALENDLVKLGNKQIDGRLTYTNNTGGSISDAVFKLRLDGEVLDDPFVEVTRGFFNSADNTITWNKETNPTLEEIPVGGSEVLNFVFQTKPLATRSAVYKNPEIVIDATVKGRRLSETGVPEDIEATAVKRIKIASDVVLEAISSYKGEPFKNTGPIPPRVEQETTYTVTLNITNSSNAIKNGRVLAYVPEYVRWNNRMIPSNERVYFDPVTRQMEWDLGDIREHAGFIDPSRTVAIQLTLIPSASQLGDSPVLLSNPEFIGLDTFTNTNVTHEAKEPSTDFGRSADKIEDAKVVE